METKLKNIRDEATSLRLTAQEKTAMKARIFGMPSPKHVSPEQSPYFIFSYQFFQARVLAPLAVLFVVFAGAGTAAAAQGALPGDILYPVKVSVNEAVEVALATTPVAKAQVEAKLAERRVEEAEALSSKGELTSDTSEALAASFETHAKAAAALGFDVSEKDPEAGVELKTHLDSTLAAHGAILASLGQGSSTTAPESSDSSDTLATRVLARADGPIAAKTALVSSQAKIIVSALTDASAQQASSTRPVDPAEEKAVIRIETRAAEALANARKHFEDARSSLDATTTAQVQAKLAEVDKLMAQGSTTLAVRDYAEARADFTQALVASIKLSTILVAQQKLDKNVVSPVLEDQSIIDTDDSAPAVLNVL